MALTSNLSNGAASASAASSAASLLAQSSNATRQADADQGDFAAALQRQQDVQSAGTDSADSADAQAQQNASSDRSGTTASGSGGSTASEKSQSHATAKPKTAAATTDTPQGGNLVQWAQVQMQAQLQAQATAAAAGKAAGTATAGLLGGVANGAGAQAGAASGGNGAASAQTGAGVGADLATAATSLVDKGMETASFASALGDTGASNIATGTKDSLAAQLPTADPASVLAGAIGAAPGTPVQTAATAQTPAASNVAQSSLDMSPQSASFAPALGQQISVWVRDGIQHAEVQLNPKDLGPIKVAISVSGGTTQVQMSADVASTRQALQQAMPQLSDALGQVGLSLTGSGVSDQSASQSGNPSSADGGSGRSASAGSRVTASGGTDGLLAAGSALAARQASQARGLLDLYA